MNPANTPVRDLNRLAKALIAALVIFLISSVIKAWAYWEQILLVDQIQRGCACTHAQLSSNTIRVGLCALFNLVAYLCTALLFLRWTYVTKKNALALGATGMESSPAWSVGWYFIPLASLWKPYEALKETFMASNPESHDTWRNAARPSMLPLWWGLWLVSSTLGHISATLSLHKTRLADLGPSSWLGLLHNMLDVPLALVVIVLVRTLQSWQADKARQTAAQASSAHAGIG